MRDNIRTLAGDWAWAFVVTAILLTPWLVLALTLND
jgi:hypothetical protein